jgi:hypothetical protein
MAWVGNNQAEILRVFGITGEPVVVDLISYDASGNPEYIGAALQGASASQAKWRIKKLTWDGSGNYTGSTFSKPNQVWDDRASLAYS